MKLSEKVVNGPASEQMIKLC